MIKIVIWALLIMMIILFGYSIRRLLKAIYPTNTKYNSDFYKNIPSDNENLSSSATPINFYLNKHLNEFYFQEYNNIFKHEVDKNNHFSIRKFKFLIYDNDYDVMPSFQFTLFKKDNTYYFTKEDSCDEFKMNDIQNNLCNILNVEKFGYFREKLYTINVGKFYNENTKNKHKYEVFRFYPHSYVEWIDDGWAEIKSPMTQLKIVRDDFEIIDSKSKFLNEAINQIENIVRHYHNGILEDCIPLHGGCETRRYIL